MALVDLSAMSGLPLRLDGSKLVFGRGMKAVKPDIRTREQMKPVLKNAGAKAPGEFYYMYRDLALEKDRSRIKANDLRYDITILPPFKVGGEYNKTFGHYHPKVPRTNTWWPEIYEILHGHALYLLQNGEEFLVYDARKGDKCVMLPGFAHVTVNPSEENVLVMANWVYPGFASNYGPIKEKRGAQWYYTEKGFEENEKYGEVPNVQLIASKGFPKFGFENAKPMYRNGVRAPEKFQWLVKPQKYPEEFKEYRKQ